MDSTVFKVRMSLLNQSSDLKNSKVVHLSELSEVDFVELKKQKIVGLCHGNFDVLHVGHINHFKEARSIVDYLIVGVTSDDCVQQSKEASLFNQDQRTEVLASIDMIDLVVIVNSESSVPLINIAKPNYYFKGPDYSDLNDPSGRLKQELDSVTNYGGITRFTNSLKQSSTEIIKKSVNSKRLKVLSEDLNLPDMSSIHQQLDGKKILVIGETILDKYNSCISLGRSAKHPIVAQQVINSEIHLGGILAIANHLSGLGCNVDVITDFNKLDENLILNSLGNKVNINNIGNSVKPTICKTRYIDYLTKSHLFETYEMNDAFIDWQTEKKLKNVFLGGLQKADTVLIVDYGHGLFTDSFIQYLKEKKIPSVQYTANAQANAGNHGLNSVFRYEWCDSIVLNGSEVQLEMRQRKLEPKKLLKNFSKKVSAPNILITLGKKGLIYKAEDGSITEKNAISSRGIVDRTGAGDALLACYVAFNTLDLSKNELLNFCNLGGYFASMFVGNEKKLTLNDVYQLSREK